MSYTALYRKWRPSTFEDVKGQDAIVTTLRNQIMANRIGHAYLFCGTRGTGKTSSAKVFAKAINCENPNNGSPCCECASCKAIATGNSMNVIEMDAASNNGIEHVRNIRDDVTYSPTDAKYKVYIIDEVHNMSSQAFNALLKTLEEPPSYVVFILATTEPHKLPITILSRCQRYDFKRITTDIISARLHEIIDSEGIKAEDKAIDYIAKTAEGGMRDALSLLDQCTSFFLGKEITYDMALDVLGAVDTAVFSEFLRDIVSRSVVDAFHLIDKILVQGRDINQFVIDFTWHLRNVLLFKATDEPEEVVDVTADNLALLKKEAEQIPAEQILRYIRVFSELANSIKYSSTQRTALEIAVIKLCKPQMEKNVDSLIDRIRVIEEMIESGELTAGKLSEAANAREGVDPSTKATQKKAIEEAKELPAATKEDLANIGTKWKALVNALPDMYKSYIRTSVPSVRPNDGKLMIQVINETIRGLCDNDDFINCLDESFAKTFGKKIEYELVSETSVKESNQYLPPVSIFGDDVVIDDSEFEDDKN